jgi:hypothetical protein
MYENISSGSLSLSKNDSTYTDLAKKVTRLLLLSAFILEIVCIFVTTVTGTMLLSRPMTGMKNGFGTALGFLWQNFQFEYLTARITFLQGLLNWLAAIALEHTIPRGEDKPATIQVNKFIASSLVTLIIYMVSFYNAHLAFYGNYFGMLCTYAKVVWLRFCWHWPPRILPIFALPSLLASLKYGWLVFADSFKYERKQQSKDE